MKKIFKFIMVCAMLFAFSGTTLTFAEKKCPPGPVLSGKCTFAGFCLMAVGHFDCDPGAPVGEDPELP